MKGFTKCQGDNLLCITWSLLENRTQPGVAGRHDCVQIEPVVGQAI